MARRIVGVAPGTALLRAPFLDIHASKFQSTRCQAAFDIEENNMTRIDRIIPLLVCEDIPRAHDFLVEAFGFTAGGVTHDPEGKPIHAEVRAGTLAIWLHQVSSKSNLVSPQKMDDSSSALVVHVTDVDAHYEHARTCGARIVYAPMDQAYGQREYGARDPEGHLWYFATPTNRAV
jgi:uncharacterized glyoxalase superfamily protein PhnB